MSPAVLRTPGIGITPRPKTGNLFFRVSAMSRMTPSTTNPAIPRCCAYAQTLPPAMAQLESPAAHTITEPAGARWIATCSIRLSPAGHATGYAGPATRGIGSHSGRMAGSITRSRVTTSAKVHGEILA